MHTGPKWIVERTAANITTPNNSSLFRHAVRLLQHCMHYKHLRWTNKIFPSYLIVNIGRDREHQTSSRLCEVCWWLLTNSLKSLTPCGACTTLHLPTGNWRWLCGKVVSTSINFSIAEDHHVDRFHRAWNFRVSSRTSNIVVEIFCWRPFDFFFRTRVGNIEIGDPPVATTHCHILGRVDHFRNISAKSVQQLDERPTSDQACERSNFVYLSRKHTTHTYSSTTKH